jgi:hypothetical protein
MPTTTAKLTADDLEALIKQHDPTLDVDLLQNAFELEASVGEVLKVLRRIREHRQRLSAAIATAGVAVPDEALHDNGYAQIIGYCVVLADEIRDAHPDHE